MRKTLLLATLLIVALGLIFAQADQSVVNKSANKLTKASTKNNNQAVDPVVSKQEKQAELAPELTQAQKIEAEEAALAVREAARQAEIAAEAAKLAAEKQKEAAELAKLKSEPAKLETPVVEVEKKIDIDLLKIQHEQELAEQDIIRHEEYERNKLLAQERAILAKTADSEANKTVQAIEEAKVLSDEEVEAARVAEKDRHYQRVQEKLAIEAEEARNRGELPVILDTEDYCATCWSYDTDDWITNVTFNTINNTTGGEGDPCSYGDYTAISTTVAPGASYTLYVTFVSGTFTEHVWAWIDWNQNEVLDDAGEAYDLGDGISTTLSLSITVPLTASLGNTRMRVTEKWNSDPTPCMSGSWGETEDYTVNVYGDPIFGACCDEITLICTDDVELVDCLPPLRFVANTLCVDLDPPCGEFEGACCYVDGSCEVLSPADCATAGGDYQGNWTDCDPNPCPQPTWDCDEHPPTGKEAGGDKDTPSEPLNDSCHTTDALVQCEYAYCGAVSAVGDIDWYQLVVPDYGNSDWTTFHFRVFADDTPGQYAQGGGLDSKIWVHTDCAEPAVMYDDDYNYGDLYPNAEGTDSQIDFDESGNLFPPGSTIYIRVSSYSTTYSSGPYLLVINCEPRPSPTGACCVDEVCVVTNTQPECDAIPGDWYQGETCHVDPDSSFYCPPEVDWDCELNPPPGKTGGGNLDVEPNDTTTTAIPVQVEYAYCGDLDPPGGDTDDYYVVTLPAGPSEYYCLHVRVFADDTPYQYAYGDSLDPWLYIYAADGTTELYSDDDYNGQFPDAVHYDCQYDCNEENNCFQAGSTLYIRISESATGKAGPYLLIINAYECETPTGACCVEQVCVVTNTQSECDAIPGVWYQG